MNVWGWNIALALVWAALSGEFTLINLLLGYAMGFAILMFVAPAIKQTAYLTKVRRGAAFVFFFSRELVISNFRVAYDVITPRYHMKPGIIAVPLDVSTDAEITLLANLITLTPGTLSLDVSDDKQMLYVHAMYLDDADALRREIKDGFERRVLELMR